MTDDPTEIRELITALLPPGSVLAASRNSSSVFSNALLCTVGFTYMASENDMHVPPGPLMQAWATIIAAYSDVADVGFDRQTTNLAVRNFQGAEVALHEYLAHHGWTLDEDARTIRDAEGDIVWERDR